MSTKVVEYWRHEKCGNKVQFDAQGAWCPICRSSINLSTLLIEGSLVSFENPDQRVIPNREHIEAPHERLHGHSRYSPSVHGVSEI